MRVRSVSILAAMIVAVAVPGAAHADPPVSHDVSPPIFTDSYDFDYCGFTIHDDYTARFNYMVRDINDAGSQAGMLHRNLHHEEVLTNPATGEWMLVTGNWMTKYMTATHLYDNVWELTTQEVGQTYVVWDSEGNLVARETGRLTFRLTVDTLGDTDPNNDIIKNAVTTSASGHHPVSGDICPYAIALIG